jgi:sulfate-transporting ATPase
VDTVAAVSLRVEGLSVAFGGVHVLQDVSLSVAPGCITGLIGANGAGKTTLLEAVSGYVQPSAGIVSVGDRIVTGRSATRLARAGIRRSFQGVESFDDLTVRENLLVASEDLRRTGWLREVLRPTAPRLPDHLALLAEEFGLTEELDRSPTELPFGRRRLLGVARALAGRPAVLLLDEPASGLNNQETSELSSLLRRVVDAQGIGVLLVEHDIDMVVELCDDVVVLDVGRVIFHGAAADLLHDPIVASAYLGDAHSAPAEAPGPEREGQILATDR